MIESRRLALLIFFLLLSIAATRDLLRLGDALPWRKMYDFQDFYCAGAAVDRGQSPYDYEPLHRCEHRVASTLPPFAAYPGLVIPAPQPPYDFVPFAALAKIGYPVARTICAFAIVAAIVLTIIALARTGIPADIATIALVLPVGYLELDAGQIVPFALLFLALAGAALAARRDALAGVCAALATIEPHLGLSAALAALIFVPRARIGVVLTGALLAVVGVVAVGPATALEYVTRVLPAHASAELVFPYQYSLTYALIFLGLPSAAAQIVGDASFLAFLLVGLWLAPRLARSIGRRELLVFFPAACAVMAGPFLHMQEVCFAIPAALVFATRLTGTPRALSAGALCLLMVPWIMVWQIKKLFLTSVFLCILMLVRLQIATGFTLAFTACMAIAIYALEFRSPTLPIPRTETAHLAGHDLAQREWRAFTEQLRTSDARWFGVKLPTWGALTTLLAVAILRVRSPRLR